MRVPPESLTTPQRTQVEGEEVPVTPEPPVQTYLVSLPAPILDDLRADAERLLEALAAAAWHRCSRVDLAVLRDLSPRLRSRRLAGPRRRARRGRSWPCSHRRRTPLGLAVDLGTTKIAAYLVDLETGETLASEGVMNPQIAYGEDVIARMAYAQRVAAAGRPAAADWSSRH